MLIDGGGLSGPEGIDSGTVFAFCLQVTPTDGNDPPTMALVLAAARES
ncbi:MAG: hypothetical protein U0931_40075 [Vulcanimicrobiota bacterium]